MKLIVVEDDFHQLDFIASELAFQFPGVEIQKFETEESFRDAIDDIRKEPPQAVIMDIMVRWTDKPQTELQRQERPAGDHRKAGIRCQELLASFSETAEVP